LDKRRTCFAIIEAEYLQKEMKIVLDCGVDINSLVLVDADGRIRIKM
jgi:hypothetical protein